MKPGRRRLWVETTLWLLILASLLTLWWRSLRWTDSVQSVFSDESYAFLASSNGSLIAAVDWKSPTPIGLPTGFISFPLLEEPNPLGTFVATTKDIGGFFVAIPHWVSISVVAAFLAIRFWRGKSISQFMRTIHSRSPKSQ